MFSFDFDFDLALVLFLVFGFRFFGFDFVCVFFGLFFLGSGFAIQMHRCCCAADFEFVKSFVLIFDLIYHYQLGSIYYCKLQH